MDPGNNHVFVPMEPGPLCADKRTFGCIAVFGH